MKKSYTVGVVGLSHLGITWSVGNADLGFKVLAYDPDQATVNRLSQGDLIIPEPGLAAQYQRAKPLLHFTATPEGLAECDVIFFAKDVPYDEEGVIDLTEIDQLWDRIIPHLAANADVVFMGQVPVGYTRRLVADIRRRRPGVPFQLVYRVETITISQAVTDFLKPDRIILGLEQKNLPLTEKMRAVLLAPFDCAHTIANYESAELTKSAINIYLANAVTFVNTIADLAENTGGDVRDIIAAMKLDKRFSPLCYWRPGLGFAGGHLERDIMSLSKLSREHDLQPTMLQTILANSKARYQWLARALEQHVFAHTKRPKIALWGLAYKKGTDSLHNAHCVKVLRDYLPKAEFVAYDPVAKLPATFGAVTTATDKFEALQGVDAVIILTEWDEFKVNDPAPFLAMRNAVVIDAVDVIGEAVLAHPAVNVLKMGVSHASVAA